MIGDQSSSAAKIDVWNGMTFAGVWITTAVMLAFAG